ncbi:hypothetical protein PSPO01_16676, partial [Paraphaeosphaeria sporulosa]
MKWRWSSQKPSAGDIRALSKSISSSAASSRSKKMFPSGIKLLHEGQNSIIDLIFIHGLTGDREKTWKAKSETNPWPKTLLPSKVPNARVLTFGYDAHVADWRGMVSKNRIGNHAMNLLAAVATYREDDDTNDRPILLYAIAWEDSYVKIQVLDCTRGVVFLGTRTTVLVWRWAEGLAKSIGVLKQTNAEILGVLKRESEVLERVQNSFHTMIRARSQEGLAPVEITCFYEELPLPGVRVVVPAHSAILPGYIPIGIRSNHMDMTKFEGVDDSGFLAVAGELRRWARALARPGIGRAVDEPSGQGVSQGDGDTRGREVLRITQGGSEFRG